MQATSSHACRQRKKSAPSQVNGSPAHLHAAADGGNQHLGLGFADRAARLRVAQGNRACVCVRDSMACAHVSGRYGTSQMR